MTANNNLPVPKTPNLEENDANQARLKKEPPMSRAFSRAYAVLQELEGIPNDFLTPFQQQDKAEALVALGQFHEAALVNTPQSEFYEKIEKAVWREDGERCECPVLTTRTLVADDINNENSKVTEQKLTVGTWFTLRNIYSQKHGAEVSLKQCSGCGSLNAE